MDTVSFVEVMKTDSSSALDSVTFSDAGRNFWPHTDVHAGNIRYRRFVNITETRHSVIECRAEQRF